MKGQLNEEYSLKFAEMSAYQAELRGLAFAIGDKELLEIVNKGYESQKYSPEERSFELDEMEIRGKSQHLHTRISQLLTEITK